MMRQPGDLFALCEDDSSLFYPGAWQRRFPAVECSSCWFTEDLKRQPDGTFLCSLHDYALRSR